MIGFQETAAGQARDLVTQVRDIFSEHGLLSQASNFEFRPQQQAMAVAVAEALQNREHLLVEAGTGVGKSLAYLIPSVLFAVANKKKAVVSTHTINLQEQLIEKDLPMLRQILPTSFSFTMLKGRHNYLCTRRLAKAMQQTQSLFTSPEGEELKRIFEWAKNTRDGSLSDFEVEPDPRVWQFVCSERGLCSPKLCGPKSEFAKENSACFFQKARGRILAADVVVLNHTLFFTLLGGVDEEMEGGVMYKNDFLVFDEAHTVEQVAARHIGLSVSNSQIRFALHRLWNPRTSKGLLGLLRHGRVVQMVADVLDEAETFFQEVEMACEDLVAASQSKVRAGEGMARSASPRGWGEVRVRRPDLVQDRLSLPIDRLREGLGELIRTSDDQETGSELLECNRRLLELKGAVGSFLSQINEQYVYWVERAGKTQRQLTLNAAPLDVAFFLRERLFGSETSVVMTSATLALSGGGGAVKLSSAATPARPVSGRRSGSDQESDQPLGYFCSRVGGEKARQLQVGSPFNYAEQMKLYLVSKMPDPREAGYELALIHWIEHFIRQTEGKAFVLFTNFKLMQSCAEQMRDFFGASGLECFVQGTGTPRSLMLEKFKQDVNSVLFGTDSFWQGVDVPGDALSNVIITRLPFSVPDHPLIEARIESIEARGGNSFAEFSLPEAILKLRQGVGRLIRTRSDRGIVVLLDNRVLVKNYGEAFLRALPKCPTEIV